MVHAVLDVEGLACPVMFGVQASDEVSQVPSVVDHFGTGMYFDTLMGTHAVHQIA